MTRIIDAFYHHAKSVNIVKLEYPVKIEKPP